MSQKDTEDELDPWYHLSLPLARPHRIQPFENGDISAARYRAHPAPPTTYKKLRGAAQDGNWDAVSPQSCTTGCSLKKIATASYWMSIIAVELCWRYFTTLRDESK